MRILITGGAGFVGSSLALAFHAESDRHVVIAFDNLRRRGVEMHLPLLRDAGIEFVHGDVRSASDLDDLPGRFDLLIEASAEPSVLAGIDGSPSYVLQTNLGGALHCLEFARKRCGALLFLSTSRVYSIARLRNLSLREGATRFELEVQQPYPGVSLAGMSESFPVDLPRSLYGASKLAAELVLQEYVHTYGMRALINRCGVIAGAGQLGNANQGVFTLWVANHYFGKPLSYTGFNGEGKQVRDLLDPQDLFQLIKRQVERLEEWSGEFYNVGGGRQASVSLQEFTNLCRTVTGRAVPVGRQPTETAVDIPLYISDHRRVSETFGWEPRATPESIVQGIAEWLQKNELSLQKFFA